MTAPICPISLATGPSRSSRAISEACKVGRDRERRQRARRQHRRDPVVATAGFEHRLGQLLDEQRHAVGALDDLVDDLAGKAGIAGEPLDQRRAVAPAEPVQRQHRHMRLAAPGVLELGAEGDDQQDRQPRMTRSTVRSSNSREVGSIQCASSKTISTGRVRARASS